MFCKRCNNSCYLQAISFGICKICSREVYCPHSPCYELCEECSNKNKYCQQCGRVVEDGE